MPTLDIREDRHFERSMSDEYNQNTSILDLNTANHAEGIEEMDEEIGEMLENGSDAEEENIGVNNEMTQSIHLQVRPVMCILCILATWQYSSDWSSDTITGRGDAGQPGRPRLRGPPQGNRQRSVQQ